ncbi:J domain-containing protein [Nodularia sphaerocarpa]|uniref:J domain-containing protein n=1 Tax=Nodularia sphaerocarpa TaxID=137816 RepID=UPI001EFC07D7|nr:J domain-containing protein [Nodularia sphaerocarpa]MDB9373491.1 J domain-containing protein [Nodularia sphaerocarpa CS-585]MDB9377601.1 J domain-containing protein [Nodularia sphaerocarpa CS-585A2]ULP74331.1 Curved DNA-binding protein [Nodularia sphaerocarpa UHCC 0038]
MSLKIDRGLFKYDFIDYHAILCVPVDADVKHIRQRYLQIARKLHPDSSVIAADEQKHLAHELLSKLVNPAYENLSKERIHSEYMIVLSQMGKRLVQDSTSVALSCDLAKQLVTAPNIDHFYKTAIANIAATQYDSLKQAVKIISQISELNLVYLMRIAANAAKASTPPPSSAKPTSNSATPKANTAPLPPLPAVKEDSPVDQYVRRAQGFIDKDQFSQAKVELQDALKLEPKNSHCHSLVGLIYLKQNQVKMAKIHFDNALKFDPANKIALTWKLKIEQALGTQSGSSKVTSPPDSGSKQPDKSGGGGLFGGLFGGKKK